MSGAALIKESSLAWSNAPGTGAQRASSNSEYQLAQRLAAGDMEAFAELYERYHRRVYSLCHRMTNNVAEAEDLTQEVFIHVYHKIGGFRGESAMMTWLHRVTVNKVLMHFRKSSVRHERTTEDDFLPEPKVVNAETWDQLLAVDRLALDRAVAQLPPGYRAIFILHDVEGYEHAEIARMQGCAVGTSKSQLHKARMKLRELLKERFQPQEQNLT
ncbi:MAG TPA: RNA polymerase sigma factor [Pyrinomonadaceae bacterium]